MHPRLTSNLLCSRGWLLFPLPGYWITGVYTVPGLSLSSNPCAAAYCRVLRWVLWISVSTFLHSVWRQHFPSKENECVHYEHLTFHYYPLSGFWNHRWSRSLPVSTPAYCLASHHSALPAFIRYLVSSVCSWIIASSQPSSPRMCAWSSIPEMPRSHRHVLCEASLVVAIQSHLTRKCLNKFSFQVFAQFNRKKQQPLGAPSAVAI